MEKRHRRFRVSKSAILDVGWRKVTVKGTAPQQTCERPCTRATRQGCQTLAGGRSLRRPLVTTPTNPSHLAEVPDDTGRCVMAFKSLECEPLAPAPGVLEHSLRHPGVSHSLNPWLPSANPPGSGSENAEIKITITSKQSSHLQ